MFGIRAKYHNELLKEILQNPHDTLKVMQSTLSKVSR